MSLTNFPNGMGSFFVDSNATEITANYSVIIPADSGKTFTIATDGLTFTLPNLVTGNTVTFVNMGSDGTVALTIDPNVADGITYAGDSTDGVTLVNTKATAKKGDYVTLASLFATASWQVVAVRGVWAKGV